MNTRILFMAAVLSASAATHHHMYFVARPAVGAPLPTATPVTMFTGSPTKLALIDSGDYIPGGFSLDITSNECRVFSPFLDSLTPHMRYTNFDVAPTTAAGVTCYDDGLRLGARSSGDQLKAVNINPTPNGSGGYTYDTIYAYVGYNQPVPILAHPVARRGVVADITVVDVLGRRFGSAQRPREGGLPGWNSTKHDQ